MLKDMIYEIEEKREELRKMTQEAVGEAQRQVQSGDDLADTANLLVELCESIKWAKSDMNTLDKEANPTLVTAMDMMGERKFAHGTFEIERRVSNYRKNWQNDSLLRSVVNTAMDEIEDRDYVDQTTGELINERNIVAPFIDAVVERLLACAAFRDWRVTALRNYMPGVDPDNYCEVESTTKAVIRRK
jgi:hypothetical protein|tara:strand:+ start:344 stop:907 length:564 start_codon:yes stop_codon:yes gene_type:complete